MNVRFTKCAKFVILGVLVALFSGSAAAWIPVSAYSTYDEQATFQTGGTTVRRVNAPFFEDTPQWAEAAILWFGRVTNDENWADARVGYSDENLWIRVSVMDRLLWYDDTSPSPADLNNWDAISLYLDLDGNIGSAPDANSYRFDGQLVWYEERDAYQAAYTGSGGSWSLASIPFVTASGWQGGEVPNDYGEDDRGWLLYYKIPFASLGLSSTPARGTTWGMAFAVHDRDNPAAAPLPDQTWPATLNGQQPATWGQLAFGMPEYEPLPAAYSETVVIRQGLNGAQVPDAGVGGGFHCGTEAGPDYFPEWGSLNYSGERTINIQNQENLADWPCFSRYYVTFPLDALPDDRVILSASLTMHQSGNAGEGWDPGPVPSFIQVLTVGESWSENTLTWNNSPLAMENVGGAWADVFPDLPGEPRQWDISRAVNQAYSAGNPLRLALYESDTEFHSGKYFLSSDTEDYYDELRPTLTVVLGNATADLSMTVSPAAGRLNDSVTFSLEFWGDGGMLNLVDSLPEGLGMPVINEYSGAEPTYLSGQHQLLWSGNPSMGEKVTIRFTTPITTGDRDVLLNSAELSPVEGATSTASALVIANPHQTMLPLVLRGH